MTTKDIKKFLLEDSQDKKVYESKYDLICKGCSGSISRNDDLYFYGGHKICQHCFYEIIDYLESIQ